ncbi:MAG TPA: FAD-binding oxidoreductase [Kribbellaceae bacterium]|nr:FAD-binding oxidoreductase [Kribbellaceae bacterium]
MTVPTRASVVIVGSGVVGMSIAFHLAEAGVPGVVVLERDTPGSGSTCRAAGGFRAQFSDALNIRIGARSIELLSRFGERPGQQIDLRQDGYLFLLSRPADVASFEQAVALQNALGVPSRIVDPEEARRLSPLVDTAGVLAASYSPLDGHCSPESVVMGYAAGARRAGARIVTHCEVLGIETRGDHIIGVATSQGTVTTPAVICAAGAWSASVGAMAGVDLPVEPHYRQVAFTGPFPDAGRPPLTIDFTSGLYFRREGEGLLLGVTDPAQQPGFDTRPSASWLPCLHAALAERAPRVLDAGLAGQWGGLYEVTPDHNALIGEAPGLSRFLYATGFSGHGFMQSPAVGEVMRDLYLERVLEIDVSPFDARRFAGSSTPRAEANFV